MLTFLCDCGLSGFFYFYGIIIRPTYHVPKMIIDPFKCLFGDAISDTQMDIKSVVGNQIAVCSALFPNRVQPLVDATRVQQ